MAVITISREFGSEGQYLAEHVAQDLKYHLVDKETLEIILKQYGLVKFDELYQSTPGFWSRYDDTNTLLISMLNQSLSALAHYDNVVILGRGGFAALAGYTNVINIKLQAPFEVRLRRVMEREKLSDVKEVETLLKANDKARSAFIQTFYQTGWNETGGFNMMFDTDMVPCNMIIPWIVKATKHLEKQSLETALTTRAIEVDPVLAKTVAEVLEHN